MGAYLSKYQLAIPEREPDGQWENEAQWINRATRDIGGMNALCADSKNRICAIGGDFMRATAEGTYPVRYWYGAGGQNAKEQRASQASARRVDKLNHPWRYRK